MNEENKMLLRLLANREGLENLDIDIFVRFVELRLPDEKDEGYLKEWARRFRRGTSWPAADLAARGAISQAEQEVRSKY